MIRSNVDIVGLPDMSQTADFDERVTLDGHNACTVVAVVGNVTASLSSLIVTGGNANQSIAAGTLGGGGIFVDSGAAVTLDAMKISGNHCAGRTLA